MARFLVGKRSERKTCVLRSFLRVAYVKRSLGVMPIIGLWPTAVF